ncbi:hypothetical protein [Streptomyces humi]|uniref:hypothetical protein n=1 Tax=Streptomyces humi TaxID=1428620 RepID=UPI001F0A3728|nr:hypothetical protein [Streptomyces humi]
MITSERALGEAAQALRELRLDVRVVGVPAPDRFVLDVGSKALGTDTPRGGARRRPRPRPHARAPRRRTTGRRDREVVDRWPVTARGTNT